MADHVQTLHADKVRPVVVKAVSAHAPIKPRRPDLLISGHGTIYTVTPRTPRGRAWIEENVRTEPYQWVGPNLCVEHRYIMPLVEGARESGLTVA